MMTAASAPTASLEARTRPHTGIERGETNALADSIAEHSRPEQQIRASLTVNRQLNHHQSQVYESASFGVRTNPASLPSNLQGTGTRPLNQGSSIFCRLSQERLEQTAQEVLLELARRRWQRNSIDSTSDSTVQQLRKNNLQPLNRSGMTPSALEMELLQQLQPQQRHINNMQLPGLGLGAPPDLRSSQLSRALLQAQQPILNQQLSSLGSFPPNDEALRIRLILQSDQRRRQQQQLLQQQQQQQRAQYTDAVLAAAARLHQHPVSQGASGSHGSLARPAPINNADYSPEPSSPQHFDQKGYLVQRERADSISSSLSSQDPTPPAGTVENKVGKAIAFLPVDDDERESCDMALHTDWPNLSKYHVLVRRQMEYFKCTEEDVTFSVQGRKRTPRIGQVAVRCRHCAHLPLRRRGRGAVYYPTTLKSVYQAAQNMATNHLQSFCSFFPDETRQKMAYLRDRRETATGGKQYWADACLAVGVRLSLSTDDLEFCSVKAPPPPTAEESSDGFSEEDAKVAAVPHSKNE